MIAFRVSDSGFANQLRQCRATLAIDTVLAFGEPQREAMRVSLKLSTLVAVLALHGCSGGSSGSKDSSGEPNLRRCQTTCTALCAREIICSPCSVDDCVNLCLGTTDGLEPVCAECVVTNPDYSGSAGAGCTPVFKSTGSADCVGVCAGPSGAGGSSGSASGEPSLRRCQSTCSALCAREIICSPCSADDCTDLCLGTTDGLQPACAECVVTNPDYSGSRGSGCTPVFNSTGSADCIRVCAGPGDAAVN